MASAERDAAVIGYPMAPAGAVTANGRVRVMREQPDYVQPDPDYWRALEHAEEGRPVMPRPHGMGSPRPGLVFRSAAQVHRSMTERGGTTWQWHGFAAEGEITLFASREKAGKSTLFFGLIRATLDGGVFLGHQCRQTNVVLLSEEPDSSIGEKLAMFGLDGEEERLHILDRNDVGGFPPAMHDTLTAACQECAAIGAGLLIVDTFAFWAQLKGENAENDSSQMQQAMRPLYSAAAQGICLVVGHHVSKATGEFRGSTALTGAVETTVKMLEEGGDNNTNRRTLEGRGRHAETPGKVVIDFDQERAAYTVIDDPESLQLERRAGMVRDLLPANDDGLTQDQLKAMTGLTQQRVAECLAWLLSRGLAERMGAGRKGDPFCYRQGVSR